MEINADDKVFMSIILSENEYTRPISVGNSKKDKAIWRQVHIVCNLKIEGVDNEDMLNPLLEECIASFKITDNHPQSNCIFVTISHILIPLLTVLKSRKIWRKTKKN